MGTLSCESVAVTVSVSVIVNVELKRHLSLANLPRNEVPKVACPYNTVNPNPKRKLAAFLSCFDSLNLGVMLFRYGIHHNLLEWAIAGQSIHKTNYNYSLSKY